MTPHKHAEVIKAWADGAEIQWQSYDSKWVTLSGTGNPSWLPHYNYRVKPQPKKCVPYKRYLWHGGLGLVTGLCYKNDTWNPDEHNGFIKWIDTEWQEHEYDA